MSNEMYLRTRIKGQVEEALQTKADELCFNALELGLDQAHYPVALARAMKDALASIDVDTVVARVVKKAMENAEKKRDSKK